MLDPDGEHRIRPLEIGDWPQSGLPWIAFWIKELLTWGTLEPVAAFLLARGDAIDRPQAEEHARAYYESLAQDTNPNDALDPRTIRDWLDARRVRREEPAPVREFTIEAALERAPGDYLRPRLSVLPLEIADRLAWVDPAGYVVARSARPPGWPQHPSSFDFELIVATSRIVGETYLRHG